jgi:hypothetical protein
MMDIHQQQQQQQEQQSSASEQCSKVVVAEQLNYQEAASHDNDCGVLCTADVPLRTRDASHKPTATAAIKCAYL